MKMLSMQNSFSSKIPRSCLSPLLSTQTRRSKPQRTRNQLLLRSNYVHLACDTLHLIVHLYYFLHVFTRIFSIRNPFYLKLTNSPFPSDMHGQAVRDPYLLIPREGKDSHRSMFRPRHDIVAPQQPDRLGLHALTNGVFFST